MIRGSVDTRVFDAKMRKAQAAIPVEAVKAVRDGVAGVVHRVLETGRRDTNRYVRGWALAGAEATKQAFPTPAVVESKRAQQILGRLVEQLEYWTFIVRRYERQGRTDRWYNQAVRRRLSAIKQIEKFSSGGGASIAFDLYSYQRARDGRALTTIRNKIYGGSGRTLLLGEKVFVEIHNKEPHTSVVEYRWGTLAKASFEFRGLGMRKYGKKFVTNVARKSGLGGAWGNAAG